MEVQELTLRDYFANMAPMPDEKYLREIIESLPQDLTPMERFLKALAIWRFKVADAMIGAREEKLVTTAKSSAVMHNPVTGEKNATS